MALSLQVLWILSALGTAVFATAAGKRLIPALVVGGFAGMGLFRGGVLPEPGWAGGLVAVGAGWVLYRPDALLAAGLLSGFLTGILSGLIQFEGVPKYVALGLAVVVPGVSFALAQAKPHFAPPQMREEALLLMLVLGLGAAVVPAVVDGWRSAGALNAAVAEGVHQAIPAWALALSGISIMLGGAWSMWRHR